MTTKDLATEKDPEELGKKMDMYLQEHDSPYNVRDLDSSEILDVLNGSYIAKRFFGRSSAWFSQRLNNNRVNGKPCEFTAEEREKMRLALRTIAWEIEMFADDI